MLKVNTNMNKKEKIIELFNQGMKLNDIATKVNTYYPYVSTTIKQYKLEQQVKNLSK
jgi:hypothetical protein